MRIRIISNDIEIDGEKVARILDIRESLKERLSIALEKAESWEHDIEAAYSRGQDDAAKE